MSIQFTNKELRAIVADVEQQLAALTGTQSGRLSKAAEESPEESAPAGDSMEGSAPADEEGSAPPPPDATGSPGGDEAPPAAEEGGEMGEGSAPAEPPAGDEAAEPAGAEGPIDPQHLMQAYMELPPEELKAHFEACKAAMESLMGGGGADAGAAPEASAPAAAPAGAPAMEPAMKSEKSADVVALQAQLDDLQKSLAARDELFDRLQKGIEKIARPERKAVVGIGAAEAPVVLTKSEALKKLASIAANPRLSKADRERINDFTVGVIGIDGVKDLLK